MTPPGGSDRPRRTLVAHAPGRVNLIGDHTDYNEGVALPMAIDLATEIELVEDGTRRLMVRSAIDPRPAMLALDLPFDPGARTTTGAPWVAMAAAVVAQVRPPSGGVARVSSTVPVGAGLSSSAAFTVALALALGASPRPEEMARCCQRAEAAAGVDVGLMDPLVIVGARSGSALLVDFSTLTAQPVPVPDEVVVVVVHSGEERRLGESPYRQRRAECEAAAGTIGRPLGRAEEGDLSGLVDPVQRRRARHVITECERVRQCSRALRARDLATAGRLMAESHESLAGDFASSTPGVDALVHELVSPPRAVYGARMTGGGFGGCVLALARPGALDPGEWPGRAWTVTPSAGATLRIDPAG